MGEGVGMIIVAVMYCHCVPPDKSYELPSSFLMGTGHVCTYENGLGIAF